MARKPVITRTIKSTKVDLLVVDTVNENLVEMNVILPRTYADEKAIKKFIETNDILDNHFVVSKIKGTEESEKRYSMPEEQFVELAEVIED